MMTAPHVGWHCNCVRCSRRFSAAAMRKLLNTLHVMTQGAYLHRDGETVAVKVDDELKLRVPVHTLEGLVCWGRVSCSPPVLGLCCERGVGISFLTEQGRFIARVNGPVSGNVLLRRQQYRMADDETSALPIVRTIVAAKIANSRVVLLRAAREIVDEVREKELRDAANRLSWAGLEASRAASIDEARGHEGMAGQAYFSVFDQMIARRPGVVSFRRPLAPASAGSCECAAVVRLCSAAPRHRIRPGERRSRPGGRLPPYRPARAPESCARPDGGTARRAG